MTERTHFQDFPSSEIDGIFLERLAELKRGASILERIDRSGDCWVWVGARIPGKAGGYGVVGLDGKQAYIHRLALELTSGIGDGLCACHRCDNRPCCRPSHLFAGTHGDNARDASEKGRLARGSRSPKAKLTEEQVAEIYERLQANESRNEIAKEFGVTWQTLNSIRRGKSWRHVIGGRGVISRRVPRGSQHTGAKLSEEQVAHIRNLSGNGATGVQLAARYGVSESTISRILSRKIWATAVANDNARRAG